MCYFCANCLMGYLCVAGKGKVCVVFEVIMSHVCVVGITFFYVVFV